MNKIISFIGVVVISALCLQVLIGCASDEKFDPEYGNSVRSMITLQTTSTSKSSYGLDGEKAILSLKKYETDVAEPKGIKKITISETAGMATSVGQ